MRTKISIPFLVIVFCMAGCSTNTQGPKLKIEGNFEYQDLKNREIFELRIHQSHLFVGTSLGLVSFKIANTLEQMGSHMDSSTVRTFLIVRKNKWLISATFEEDPELNSIYKSSDQGSSWLPFRNGFGDGGTAIPLTMDYHPNNPAVIYARGPSVAAKSTTGGKSWKSILHSWDNPYLETVRFIKVDPNRSDHVWTGGANGYFQPLLFKSSNGGKKWKGLIVIQNVETTVWDVAIHPKKSKVILAGCAGVVPPARIIRKSNDGGENWHTVLQGINTHTLAHSVSDPRILYASGRNAKGTLFFAVTTDFGETWERVTMENSPTGIIVNDMISVMENDREVLYFGTNKGLYSFTFDE